MSLEPKNFFDLAGDIATLYESLQNTNKFTNEDKRKLSQLLVENAVDLDELSARVNGLTSAFVPAGDWDPASGAFPGGGGARAGQVWLVAGSGDIDGRAFNRGDRIVALIDGASVSVYDSQWFHEDFTDAVRSVAGERGDISAADLLAALGVAAGAEPNEDGAAIAAKLDAFIGNGAWRTGGGPAALTPVAAGDIADIDSALNQTGKIALRQYFDTTNSRVMIATGGAPGDDWVSADGAVTVTPVGAVPASQISNDTPQTDEEYANFAGHFIMGGLHENQI